MNQPLYKKIYTDLLEAIRTRQLLPDTQLPTEKELSEKYGVSRITSKRALTELEQQGYIYRIQGKGSFVAKNTVKNNTSRILFSTPFNNEKVTGCYIEGLEHVLSKAAYDLFMVSYEYLKEHSSEDIRQNFAGLVYFANNTEDNLDLLFGLETNNFPLVILDKQFYDLQAPTVVSDNFVGGEIATAHLLGKGHRRIAYIFWDKTHPQSARQRYLGYLAALNKLNLPFHSTMENYHLDENLINQLIADKATGLVCENDVTAIELTRLLRKKGFSLPRDFSVVGFDDIQAAALVDPPLTTISQDFQALGELAGETLLKIMAGEILTGEFKLPVQLIERQSVRDIKK